MSTLFKWLVSHCLNSLLISNNIIVMVIALQLAYQDGILGCSPEFFFLLCTHIINKQSTQVFELPTSTNARAVCLCGFTCVCDILRWGCDFFLTGHKATKVRRKKDRVGWVEQSRVS